MRSMMNAKLRFCTLLMSAGLIAPIFAVAQTRDEGMARSRDEAQPRRQAAPRIPSQPSDIEMAALIQKHLDSTRNNTTRALVDRCNAGKPKDEEEQQYCRGWFDMERARTREPGKMRYNDVRVSSLTIRSCDPTTNALEYHCFLNVRLNIPILQPAVAIAKVRRQGTGWQLLEASF